MQGIYATAQPKSGVTVNPAFLNCCIQNSLVPHDKKDFAPRIGLSWRPFDTDRFVVRAGLWNFLRHLHALLRPGAELRREQSTDDFAGQLSHRSRGGNEQASLGPRLQPVVVSTYSWPWEVRWEAVCLRFPRGTVLTFINISYILNQVNWPKNHNPYNQQWTLDFQFAVLRRCCWMLAT